MYSSYRPVSSYTLGRSGYVAPVNAYQTVNNLYASNYVNTGLVGAQTTAMALRRSRNLLPVNQVATTMPLSTMTAMRKSQSLLQVASPAKVAPTTQTPYVPYVSSYQPKRFGLYSSRVGYTSGVNSALYRSRFGMYGSTIRPVLGAQTAQPIVLDNTAPITMNDAMNNHTEDDDGQMRVSRAIQILQQILNHAEVIDVYKFIEFYNMLCEVNDVEANPDNKAPLELFGAFDTDNNMMIDYNELLFGLAQLYTNDTEELQVSSDTFSEACGLLSLSTYQMDLSQVQGMFRKLAQDIVFEDQQLDDTTVNAAAETLFYFLDRNNNLKMDINEIYAGLMLLLGAQNEELHEQVARISFNMFDINNDKQIQFQELVHYFTSNYIILDVFQNNEKQSDMASRSAYETAVKCFEECGQDLENGGLNFEQFLERFQR